MAAYAQNQAKTPDAPQVIRDVAEKTTAQAKETFQQMSAAAGEATNVLKNSCSATFKGTQNYGAKVLEFANANINAAVEQSRKLSSVTSPMEFFAPLQQLRTAAIRNMFPAGSGTRCNHSEYDDCDDGFC
jgi:hypothetical protein